MVRTPGVRCKRASLCIYSVQVANITQPVPLSTRTTFAVPGTLKDQSVKSCLHVTRRRVEITVKQKVLFGGKGFIIIKVQNAGVHVYYMPIRDAWQRKCVKCDGAGVRLHYLPLGVPHNCTRQVFTTEHKHRTPAEINKHGAGATTRHTLF